jgi:Recombination endonuclease VII
MKLSKTHWNKKHPERMAEATRRWRSKNPEKAKAANRRRNRRFQRYGVTSEDFKKMIARQHYRCYGCMNRIDDRTANVDHKHDRSEKVRGLLCRECNWALGLVRDNPSTLRRLMAYLDYDRLETHIYLIGALKNPRIPEIGNRLRKEGFDVMDEWFTPGPEADTNWQNYEKQRGRTYAEALKGRAATNIFLFDRSYLDLSDIAVLVMPVGKSGMLELGYAKGLGKKTYIFLDGADPDRYDIMPNFADAVISTEEELISILRQIRDHSIQNAPF